MKPTRNIPATVEQWCPIPGYGGRYEASDRGRIRSVERIVTYSTGRVQRYPGHVLSPAKGGKRYSVVALYSAPGVKHTVLVHQAVLAAFAGPKPDGLVVRHLNDDPDDNRLTNLAYGTYSDNVHDSIRNGGHVMAGRTHCPQGHPYAGDNLLTTPKGWRRCRTCDAAKSRRRRRNRANSRNEEQS